MRAYEELGYAAVAITDHDHMSWTPTLEDPGGHNIVHLPGVEYSGNRSQSWDHMIGVGVDIIFHEDGMLNRAAQIQQARMDGGAAYLAHPYDASARHRRGWDRYQVIDPALEFDGMEILNGGSYITETPGVDLPTRWTPLWFSERRSISATVAIGPGEGDGQQGCAPAFLRHLYAGFSARHADTFAKATEATARRRASPSPT